MADARFSHRVMHELGHAVGMPHHGDTAENWRLVPGKGNVTPRFSVSQRDGGPPSATPGSALNALLIDPGPACQEWSLFAATRDGRFVGCISLALVRRGQQNSGSFDCPMRYAIQDEGVFYEPPGTTSSFASTGWVKTRFAEADWLVDAWTGRFVYYDPVGDATPEGPFCTNATGTVINEGRGDENHAGDAGRRRACVDFLVVNDVAARGVR
jgi:hypothetical protein